MNKNQFLNDYKKLKLEKGNHDRCLFTAAFIEAENTYIQYACIYDKNGEFLHDRVFSSGFAKKINFPELQKTKNGLYYASINITPQGNVRTHFYAGESPAEVAYNIMERQGIPFRLEQCISWQWDPISWKISKIEAFSPHQGTPYPSEKEGYEIRFLSPKGRDFLKKQNIL